MSRPIVLLQNAWSFQYAGSRWPRHSWLRALEGSLSGSRLAAIFGPDCFGDGPTDPWFDNTTRAVAAEPSGVCPPDWKHCEALFRDRADAPFVLACGVQARQVVLKLWPGRYLCMPHPAWRFVSEELLALVRQTIERGTFQRARVVTGRAEPPRIVHEFTGAFATSAPNLWPEKD